jgi:hypothetical protein
VRAHKGLSLHNMYSLLVDKGGVEKADEWRASLKPLQKAWLRKYEVEVVEREDYVEQDELAQYELA